ncbi:unnamed protein product, partial [Adineta ricciae]
EVNNESIFNADEKIKLKEVWVIVKQNNMKKLGDDIMERALKKSSTLINYWYNAYLDQSNNLTFSENDSSINRDALAKQVYCQHGYKVLEKVDQVIMTMVTRTTPTNNNNNNLMNESFRRVAESHAEYKITQNHVDVICESFLESLKSLMYQNSKEWTIKHELAWTKLFTLTTGQFLSATPSTATKKSLS